MQFKAFEPGIENSGESLGAIVNGFKKFPTVAEKYLIKHGFLKPNQTMADLDTSVWYPEDAFLRAFEAITNEVGLNSLYGVGRQIPETAVFPPMNGIVMALESIDVAYHMNHRKNGVVMFDPSTGKMLEGIGHFLCKPIANENRAVMECETPYPCDFERGLISAVANKFERGAKTVHDSDGPCRKNGANSCNYNVWW
jgi:hypothetical protein